jgi:hypothetical protein
MQAVKNDPENLRQPSSIDHLRELRQILVDGALKRLSHGALRLGA